MERKNPKQLRLQRDVEQQAEEMHRQYQVHTKQHNMTFVEFGNLVLLEGMASLRQNMKNEQPKRKIRRAK